MKKLNARDLGCFDEVAAVIGEKSAEIELQRVLDYWGSDIWDITSNLDGCFGWWSSPQSNEDYHPSFWEYIKIGMIPRGYKPHYIFKDGEWRVVKIIEIKKS